MADAKKNKMSKADKERMKKEEAERKALEEEAAKIKALEEAKKQKKEEAAMAVERMKLENEERKRRRQDMTELQELLDKNKQALQDLNHNRRVQAKWARYMRCDGSPDPTIQGEINTYINLRLEDDSRNDAVSVLKDILLDVSLIGELRFLLEDTPDGQLTDAETTLFHETTTDLENLMSKKLDLATLQILCDASGLSNPETNNLQHVVSNDVISLCVWGNLTKNPRIKNYEFPEVNVMFEIPKVLALSDCAVRVLITKFDHFSPTSKASIPRRKKKEIECPEPTEEDEKKDGEDGEKEGEDGKEEEKEGEGEEEEKEETELDLMAALRGETGEEEEQKEEEEEQEEPEEDYQDPSTPEPTEWEDFEEDDDIMDLRANDVLGGIFHINLLHMPPQPKTAGSWTITQLVDPPEIVKMDYVGDPPAPVEEKNGKDPKDNKDKDKDVKKDEKPPITINMTLPKDVLFLEEPQVAHWDYNKKFWSSKDISDIAYNEDARSLSFKMNCFGTICLLQDMHINMPFQSWEIRPHKLNSCVLSIIAAIVEIEIEIKDALCCLTHPHDKPELQSIRNKWVTPSELITMMKRAGVNVFPNEDSSKYVSIQNKETGEIMTKHPLIEERIYEQMALTASAMAYSWSKWNGETNREQVVFQASEALEDEPLLEEDWWVMLATKRRVTKLKMTEFDETFDDQQDGDGERLTVIGPITETSSTAMSKQNGKSTTSSSKIKQSVFSKASLAVPIKNPGSQSSVQMSHTPSPRMATMAHTIIEQDESVDGEEEEDVPLFYKVFDHDNSVYKSNIYHLMKEISSETAQGRVNDTSFEFINCVNQLLKATKVLTYA